MTADNSIDIIEVDATSADVMAALHAMTFADDAETWTAQAFTELLRMPGAIGWTAIVSEQPGGFALARIAGGECEIISLGVVPELQRKGLARRLLEAVIDAALLAQSSVILEVAEDNHAAINLYAESGFVEVGLRRDYYRRPSGAINALILRRDGHSVPI